ncbi:SRC kinase signaling inhibitor 1 [Carlito syrichta]|uniref:SRC kinase signaling inhibitor 1 n=1 Tax=Carlito syrichta TaxID=1868482 RepID=A0A1U7TL56_CARSF|nr:SRC kinase signaling inhibitor 1 [Carlito syrichta]
MDHLKSKYPQHALALRGQQDRMREQVGGWTVDPVCLLSSLCSHLHGDSAPSGAGQPAQQPNYWSFKQARSSRHTQGAQPGLADQAAKLSYASAESLETMSEAELPLGFSRMNRFRQSLPLSRSASQTKLRSPGVLFLQFGEETRRVHITHEVSSLDTLHALIAHMFPQKLTMGMLKSPNTAILIKDEARNVFYELEDVRDIQDRSIIKIYRKEPLYAAFPGSHLTNGDLRREMVYASRESSPTRRLNNLSPAPHLASSSPPPGERMEAMEKQIASLTGLVQSALLRGSEPETPSEKIESSNGAATPSAPCGSGGRSSGAPPVSGPPLPVASSTPAGQPTAASRLQMQLHLRGLQSSASDLRGQLQQLRKLQVCPFLPAPPPLAEPLHQNPVPSLAPSSRALMQSLSASFLPLPFLKLLPPWLNLSFLTKSPPLAHYPSPFRPCSPSPKSLQFPLPEPDSLPSPAWQMVPPVRSLASLCPLLKRARGPSGLPEATAVQSHCRPLPAPQRFSPPSPASAYPRNFTFALRPPPRQPFAAAGGHSHGLPPAGPFHDLEKSVEKIQREVSHNHRLVPGPELEEKALVLKQLGETLTELKAHFPGLQSKMRVVLRVEVEAVKFLKEEPQRLDGLLKRCRGVTDTLAQLRRQVDEGVWPPPNNLLSQSPKKVTVETDFSKSLDFEMPPPSPPLNLHELSGQTEGASLTPKGGNPTKGLDAPGKRSVDKAVNVEAAERDWEEKRAALTQYSAKDINRLLEETQAELLKAIPDLDCASKAHPGPAPTPDHKPPKAPHGQKAAPRTEPSGRRGSDELTVPRYRTEKPSKSPPPPPPRRSFPSSHGLTTTRTGEVVVTSKKDSAFIKKAESEELEVPKPQVKLRRAVSEVARPASTPPIMASAIKDEDDEDRIIAELEVFERSSVSSLPPTPRRQPIPTLLSPQDLGPPGGSAPGPTWKSGGGSVPPMKVVTPGASRLKAVQGQAGSPDKGKHGKQRAEYMRIQAQQFQCFGSGENLNSQPALPSQESPCPLGAKKTISQLRIPCSWQG